MTLITSSRPAASRPAFSFLTALGHHLSVWRQRQALKTLDDARLKDLGLSRAEADAEARRAIWDAPETWRC